MREMFICIYQNSFDTVDTLFYVQVNWDDRSSGMYQVYFKRGGQGVDPREVDYVRNVGRNYGIQGGNILVQINDTRLNRNITRAEFDNLRTKTAKPMRCLFLRKQTATQESNIQVQAGQAMQEIGPKYVRGS
jgi:hypothetical protein